MPSNSTPPSNPFWFFPNFSWIFFSLVLKKYCNVLHFLIYDFSLFFTFSLTWVPMGAKTSDGSIKLLLNYSNFSIFLTKDLFWSFYFMILNEFYCGNSLSPLCHIGKPTRNCYYHERSHRKEKWSRIVSLGQVFSVCRALLTPLMSFCANRSFDNLVSRKWLVVERWKFGSPR